MNDFEIIRNYNKHYKLKLIQYEDFDYTYTKRVESEIVTNKKFNKLLLKSSMLRKMLKNYDIGKNLSGLSYLWACDYMNKTQYVHPPYFVLQFEPKSREIVSYPGIPVMTWKEGSLPTEPIQYERIVLPFREYLVRDREDDLFMDFDNSESYIITSDSGYTLIRSITKKVVNVKKLFNAFIPVFIDMGLDVSFEYFKVLYKTKELDCELLQERFNSVKEFYNDWKEKLLRLQRIDDNMVEHDEQALNESFERFKKLVWK